MKAGTAGGGTTLVGYDDDVSGGNYATTTGDRIWYIQNTVVAEASGDIAYGYVKLTGCNGSRAFRLGVWDSSKNLIACGAEVTPSEATCNAGPIECTFASGSITKDSSYYIGIHTDAGGLAFVHDNDGEFDFQTASDTYADGCAASFSPIANINDEGVPLLYVTD